jgi:sulfur carrier protein ThiS
LARILTHGLNAEVITLSINGTPRAFPATLNAAELIATLGYAGKRIALERNGEIGRASCRERVS